MANAHHGKNGKFIRTLALAEQDAEAARLRSLGHSFDAIARTLGYADASGAYRAVMRKLAEVGGEHREAARRLELDRIDGFLLTVQEVIAKPGPLTDARGQPVLDEETGERLPDQMVRLHAVERGIKLLERRAKVMGTDAPRRQVSTIVDAPLADLQAAAAQVRAQLGIDLGEPGPPAIAGTVESGSEEA